MRKDGAEDANERAIAELERRLRRYLEKPRKKTDRYVVISKIPDPSRSGEGGPSMLDEVSADVWCPAEARITLYAKGGNWWHFRDLIREKVSSKGFSISSSAYVGNNEDGYHIYWFNVIKGGF